MNRMNRQQAEKVKIGDDLNVVGWNESEPLGQRIDNPVRVYGIVHDNSQTGINFVVKNRGFEYVVLDAGWFAVRSKKNGFKARFEVGDRVEWDSQAQGRTKTKRGVVVRIIKAGEKPRKIAERYFSDHRRMFDGSRIPRGYEIGYFVSVPGGKYGKAMPKLYFPYPNKLVDAT